MGEAAKKLHEEEGIDVLVEEANAEVDEILRSGREALGLRETEDEENFEDQADVRALADHLLYNLGKIEDEIEETEAVAERRKAMVDHWRDDVVGRARARATALKARLGTLFRLIDTGKKKSIKLPSGDLGTKASRGKIHIDDEDRAIAYARQHRIHVGVKRVQTLKKDDLRAHVEETGAESGPGWRFETGTDAFFAKPRR